MTPPRHSLRPPLLALGIALGLAGLLVLAAGHFSGQIEDNQSVLVRTLADARIHLQHLRTREASFRADAEAYAQLVQRGVEGPEQRVAWATLAGTQARRHGLTRADWQLGVQHPFGRYAAEDGRPITFSATRVQLQLEAPHEGRLLDFLDGLQVATPGWLVLRECQFDGATAGHVAARCTLDWMTLDP